MKRYMKKNDVLKFESKSFLAGNEPQFGLMLNHVHPYLRLSVREGYGGGGFSLKMGPWRLLLHNLALHMECLLNLLVLFYASIWYKGPIENIWKGEALGM